MKECEALAKYLSFVISLNPQSLPSMERPETDLARNRPITQNRWLCVNSASKPSTATISNCSFCDLCAIRSGKVCKCR